jgi:hypothetical protein
MPQRQQTQGDFGLRPTKVTQGITDVYHAPSIPKPSVEGLNALAQLSKTAMGLIVEQDNLEKKNAAIAEQTAYRQGVSDRATASENRRLTKEQTAAGLAFGEDHPFADVAADSPESYMIGHSEGRGNALRRIFRKDEQAQWDVASQADTGLLRDFTARTQHHDEALVAFLEEQGIDGIARETFLRGAEEYSFELTGKHRAVAMGENKADFLATGQDMVLNAISSLEGITTEVDGLDDTAVLEELNPEGKAPPANAQGYLNMEEHRAELMQNRAAPLTAELQQHLQTAYAMGDSVLKEAVASMSEDLIEEMTNGTNPTLAQAIFSSLKTGTGDFAARPDVVSAYRVAKEGIHNNIQWRARTLESKLEMWRWVKEVPQGATLEQARSMEEQIKNHPHLPDKEKLETIATLWKNWDTAQVTKQKTAQLNNSYQSYSGGRGQVSFDKSAEQSGLSVKDFATAVEDGLKFTQNEDGDIMELAPEEFVAVLADFHDLPLTSSQTSKAIKSAVGFISSNNVGPHLDKVKQGLDYFKGALPYGDVVIDRLGLSDEEVTVLRHAVTRMAADNTIGIDDLPNVIPKTLTVAPKRLPDRTYIQDNFEMPDDSWLPFTQQAVESYSPQALIAIEQHALYIAQLPENDTLDKDEILERTAESMKALGVILQDDGSMFRLPKGSTVDHIEDINTWGRAEAFKQLKEERNELNRIRKEINALTPSEAAQKYGPSQQEVGLMDIYDFEDETSRLVLIEFERRNNGRSSIAPLYSGIDEAGDMPIKLASSFELAANPVYDFISTNGVHTITGFTSPAFTQGGFNTKSTQANRHKKDASTRAATKRAEEEVRRWQRWESSRGFKD